ncbi:hypothetical protein [Nocardiopsis sp. NRRL B-16309]|uniref:hypothetical protein n=1 Tax=Nocardiopsis sp. NRRL B-16309 TaxID=1519494 RepID=UPI0006ADFEBF|nr:hypothetical protein [Nocardiopsis sp. NRRL B-16309]KOX11669.1 hypothetical protein ADL05_23195 [Nocardiopsis sp. NRRL B-16309]
MRSDDADQYAAAAALDRMLPLWWVYWAPYWRRFTAIWQGPGSVPVQEAKHTRDLRLAAHRAQDAVLAPPSLRLRAGPAPPAPWEPI